MRRVLLPFIALLFIGLAVPSRGDCQDDSKLKKVTLPANKAKLHLYVLMGQANMSGRGQIYEKDKKLNDRLITLTKEENWKLASEPLHWDKPQGIVGVGPGRAFGEAMLLESEDVGFDKDEKVKVGLIPCAETGANLSRWEKGGDLYGRTLKRIRRAMKDGTLKGFLWQHGETDAASYTAASTYGDRLQRMIADMREELGQRDVPFVAGKVSRLLPFDRFPATDMVNSGIESLPKRVDAFGIVSTDGLNMMTDGIHFDGQSSRVLGKRFAGTMRDVQKKAKK
jgi:hypothetical protein